MSQFPRPRYQTTLPSGESVGVQSAGIPDPVMGSDPASRQLQGALGDLTQAVGIAGNMAERNANAKERAAQKADIDAEKQRRNQWGAVSRATSTTVRENLPGDIKTLNDGAGDPVVLNALKEGNGDPDTIVHLIAEARMVDVPEEFRADAVAHYESLYAGRFSNALYAKQTKDQANAKKVAFGGLTDNLLLLDDPSKITATMNEAAKTIPGAKTEDLDTVASKAMFVFARDGNEPMVKGFKSMLGNREKDQQAYADDLLAVAKGKQEVKRQQDFADRAATIREEARDSKASPATVKAQIEAAAKELGIERRYVEEQVRGVNAAIDHQREEEAKQLAYETIANGIAVNDFVAVNGIVTNAGDATTPQTGLITPIDFQPTPGLPEELGGVKAKKARFIEQARFQTRVDINNLDDSDGVNVNQWTRYVRTLAGTKQYDDQISNTLQSLDFGSTDKEGAQVNNPQNERAIRTYLMVASINKNYADSMVKDPQAKKVYDSVSIDMLTPGAKLSSQIVNAAIAKGQVKPQDEARPGSKEYDTVLKAAPNLTPSMVQYAVRTYNDQKGKDGALDYAVSEASSRGVQLWQSWAGWANWAVPFTRSNSSPTRPLVDLGTLASEDPSVRPAIGTAMESLLEEKAKEIKKLDPTLETEATDLSLNYIGRGVWEVQGIKAGGLDAKYDHLFYVTDAQVRERVGRDANKVEPLAELEKQLAEVNKAITAENSDTDTWGTEDFYVSKRREIETKIKVRKLQSKKAQ